MALQVWYQPQRWSAAYAPIIWQFWSDLYPMTDPRYSGFQLFSIRQPDDSELALYPQLTADSVLIEHGPIDGSAYYVGATLDIYNTNTGLYEGTCKVLDRIGLQYTVVDLTWKKAETGGFFRVHLTNFQVWCEVLSENMTDPVILKLRPTKDFQGTTVFEADPRDILARHFKDLKNLLYPEVDASTSAIIGADGYITQTYSLKVYEAYDVVGEDGVSTFTTFESEALEVGNQVAVNAVHPYHETRRDGTVRLGWTDTLADYLVRTNTTSSTRMLTHASASSQFVTAGDDHFLCFLYDGARPVELKVIVAFYSEFNAQSGSFISNAIYRGDIAGNSGVCAVGPANITVPANAKSYRVALFNQNENQIAETFLFNVRPCEGANVRFHYLNKLGGVDSFTFQGDEERVLTVKRDIVSKPHMNNLPGFFTNDWQRRVWRTQTDRRYSITSGYLLPEQIRSVTETLFESANVWTNIAGDYWTNVLIFTGETPADGSSGRRQRMALEYGLGVDNVTQRT